MGIGSKVTVYAFQRGEKNELVLKANGQPRKYVYGKYEMFNRPPMLYLEVAYEGGGVETIGFERTGPDEYTEYLRKEKADDEID